MVSGKDRMRIARHIDAINARIERQKDALTRLLAIQMECIAALSEIADVAKESHRVAEWESACGRASGRAQLAIERVSEMAAATRGQAEELLRKPNPTPDGED